MHDERFEIGTEATVPRAGEAGRQGWLRRASPYIPMLLGGSAVVIWGISLRNINVRDIDDFGVIAALPPAYFVALFLLVSGFSVALFQSHFRFPFALLYIIAMNIFLHGTVPIIEGTPRYAVAWRNIGISDHILRTGTADANIDAFFNWPGFYILVAFATKVMGIESFINVSRWSSIYLNLVYLLPLFIILRSMTIDKRFIALGLWFFTIANWIGQDYFSAQGHMYFLYLVIIAILVEWFPVHEALHERRHSLSRRLGIGRLTSRLSAAAPVASSTATTGLQRASLLVGVAILCGAVVPSHQLTPLATLASMTALTIAGRLSPKGLPVFMTILVTWWVMFMTIPYLAGHFNEVAEGVGSIGSNFSAGVGERLRGSPEHLVVLRVRLVMTVAIGALAACGAIRLMRRNALDVNLLLLMLTPISLLGLQGYGGEMVLRVYLFALPAMAGLAVGLFFPSATTTGSWRSIGALSLVSLALCTGFLVAGYGNERADYFTQQEIDAVEFLYNTAPQGSVLIGTSTNLPWQNQGYTMYTYRELRDFERERFRKIIDDGDVDEIAASMRGIDSYLIMSRSARASLELYSGISTESLDQLEENLKASPEFKVIFANRDATIFVLTRP